MSLEKFTEDELEVKQVKKSRGGEAEFYNTPITSKENILRLYEGKTPMWIPLLGEIVNIKVDCDPDNIARQEAGGVDGWGVTWQWVPEAGGAMVMPGHPLVEDMNDWEKHLTIPDPDKWDWAGAYERQKGRIEEDKMFEISVGSCLYERLIAVMDYAGAAMALIDEDQTEAVHRFFRVVTDARIKYYTNMKKWFNPDMVNFNDDWGTAQKEAFSVPTAKEMLVPYAKEAAQCARNLGMYIDLHSCGIVEKFVPFFIEEGFNSWGGQDINDKVALKKQYGDKFIFTRGVPLPKDYTDEQLVDAIAKYMEEFGYDNRCFCSTAITDKRFHKAFYEASRRNYDRLVAEGKAIL